MELKITAKNLKWTRWIAVSSIVIYAPLAIAGIITGAWYNIFLLLIPPYYIYLYYNYKKNMTRRYIQWDNKQLRYFMPFQKEEVELTWMQIINMNVNVLSIDIILADQLVKIDLNNVTYEDIQIIKKQLPAFYNNLTKENAA